MPVPPPVGRRRTRGGYEEAGPWLIGSVFVCSRSFQPHTLYPSSRIEPGVYEVRSFWNHGPMIDPIPGIREEKAIRLIHIEWDEVLQFGKLLSPEEYAEKRQPPKRPKRPKILKKRRTLWDRLQDD